MASLLVNNLVLVSLQVRLNLRGFLILITLRDNRLLSVLLDGVGLCGQFVRDVSATAKDDADVAFLNWRLDLLKMISSSLITRCLVDAKGRGIVDSGLVGHVLGVGSRILGDLAVRIWDFAVDDDELDRLRRFSWFVGLHILLL